MHVISKMAIFPNLKTESNQPYFVLFIPQKLLNNIINGIIFRITIIYIYLYILYMFIIYLSRVQNYNGQSFIVNEMEFGELHKVTN